MKGDFFPLQTSLISLNFPARQPPGWCMKTSLIFGTAVAVQGSFWADWEVRGGKKCGYRARLVSGVRLDVMPYASAEIPPAGAPSGFDGTPQAFALK